MMEKETPRTRSLLRQAARNVEGGKIVAAEQLYRQIIDENPNSAAAWLGLAGVTQDISQKEAAYERVLTLDSDNAQAMEELAIIRGEPGAVETQVVDGHTHNEQSESALTGEPGNQSGEPVTPQMINAASDNDLHDDTEQEYLIHQDEDHIAVDLSEVELFCYRHPHRSTSLRCYKCNNPICSECAVKTPVGYLCPDCHREAEDAFFNAKPTDYLLALLVALPLSLLAGWLVVRFSGGIFMILLFIFAGGAVGGFIARLSKRVMGNRRGRYIPHLIAACIVIGVLIWAWPWLIVLFTGSAGVLFKLAGIGVYLFTAASSAFYWAR